LLEIVFNVSIFGIFSVIFIYSEIYLFIELDLDEVVDEKDEFMQIIALTNQKSGVGKTTCAINIGAGLNKLNKRVLLIDLDPQAHLTYSMGMPAHELKNTVYRILNKS